MRKNHGFTTKEGWENYFSLYFSRIRTMEETSAYAIYDTKNSTEWLASYQEKSIRNREMYLENERYLDDLISYYIHHSMEWEKPVADALLDYLYRYCTRFEDIEASYSIASSLYEFYEKKQDEIAMMKCNMVFIISLIFLDIPHHKARLLDLLETSIQLYERHFDELSEEEQSIGLSFYDCENTLQCDYTFIAPHVSSQEMFACYDRRIKRINHFLDRCDLTLPVNQIVPSLKNNWTTNFITLPVKGVHMKFTASDLLIFRKELQQACTTNLQISSVRKVQYRITSILLQYLLKEIDATKAFALVKQEEKKLPWRLFQTWEEYDDELLDTQLSIASIYQKLLPEVSEVEDEIQYMLKRLLPILITLPNNNYLEHVADSIIYRNMIPLMKDLSKKEALTKMMQLIVARQPQTAVHEIMVSKLAKCVTRATLERMPEAFFEVCHVDSIEEVSAHAEELLSFIREAALLHDVGKILCTNVINTQYRKLIDIEFATIKYHPVTSGEILAQIPALCPYRPIALWHHKSYDRSFGYPQGFDEAAASQAILIDIITICDTLDAASDHLGRNYATVKSLDVIVKELEAGKGTRYHPAVVDCIRTSESLQQELEDILLNERKKTYMEVYELMVKGLEDVETYETRMVND